MELDAVLLSRLQFAFTIAFHIIFPTFTIGLSAYIATLLVMWRRSGRERYRTLADRARGGCPWPRRPWRPIPR